MRRVAIIQTRMTSTRLPGKVLMELAGRPMLDQILGRLARASTLDELCVATTTNATDDAVVAVARGAGARVFRGDEHDVLSRFVGAAREARADVVIRITADCPLIDPTVVDRVVSGLDESGADYASNVHARTFPRGLDAEALHVDVLERIGRLATSRPAREHVTWFIRERPELFIRHDVVDPTDNSDLRWTVDEAADLELVRQIYALGGMPERFVPYAELIATVRRAPELFGLNAHVAQKHS